MVSRIMFPKAKTAELISSEPAELPAGGQRVRTTISLMSTGTEGICCNGDFDAGSHWDSWVKYPFHTGYCTVGVVTEGPNVGQRVAVRAAHASEVVAKPGQSMPVPDGVADEQAVWFALALIGFMGAKAAPFQLGSDIAILGAGPIGQMAVRWAKIAGARSIRLVDPVAGRLELAGDGVETYQGTSTDAVASWKNPPEIVVDATGAAPVLPDALKLVQKFGTVVMLGDAPRPSDQRLAGDLVTRGIRLVGAHIMHETEKWTEASCTDWIFQLMQQGRFNTDGLASHTFAPGQCSEAYALAAARRSDVMAILFDWR